LSVGDVAGLIAAVAFVALVGFLALPLIKLGAMFDRASDSLREVTEHSLPVIDETASAIAQANTQLTRLDTVTSAAADMTANLSALSTLFSATLGGPLIKVAAFSFGVRQAFAARSTKRGGRRP